MLGAERLAHTRPNTGALAHNPLVISIRHFKIATARRTENRCFIVILADVTYKVLMKLDAGGTSAADLSMAF